MSAGERRKALTKFLTFASNHKLLSMSTALFSIALSYQIHFYANLRPRV